MLARSVQTFIRGGLDSPKAGLFWLASTLLAATPAMADITPVPVIIAAGDTVSFRDLAARSAVKAATAPNKYASSSSNTSDTPLLSAPRGFAPASASSGSPEVLAADAPMPSANFQALPDDGQAYTPDIAAAVGLQHLMVALNSQVRIQDRKGEVLSTITLDEFWASLGSPFCAEPRLLFDPYLQRWIFTANANAGTNNPGLLVAVSQTSDPTGNWHRRFISTTNTYNLYADRPTLGFNKDWIVVQANLYYRSNDTFRVSTAYVFNKTNLYAGGSLQPLRLEFTDAVEGFLGGSHVPAVMYDTNAANIYFVQTWAGNYLDFGFLRLYSLEGSPPSVPRLKTTDGTGRPGPYASTPYGWESEPPATIINFAPQLNSTNKIFAGDDSIQNVVFRGGLIFAVHTVFLPASPDNNPAPDRTSIQWWTITPGLGNSSLTRFDAGAGDPDHRFFAFPSIAVNLDLDVLVGYSRFSQNNYPCAGYAYQGHNDPFETARGDTIFRYGEAPYYVPDGSGVNQWGAYSSAIPDPLNDTDLWTVQQYAELPVPAGSRWGTWWARVSPDVDLAITQSEAPDPVYAGTPLTYSLTVTNLNPSRASGVVVSNALPANAVFVSASVPGGTCSFTNGVVTCDLGLLDNFQARTVTLVVLPFTQGLMSNVVSVSAYGRDLNPTNNTAQAVTTVQESADLAVLMTDAPDPVAAGQDLTYTLTVTNRGRFSSTGVWLTNTLPASVTFVSSAASPGACTRNGTLVNCNLGTISNASAASVTILVRPTTSGSVTNRARVIATTYDSDLGNNNVTNATKVNLLPTLSAIGARTMSEDTVLGPLAFTVSDAETPATALVVTAASSNPALVSTGGLALGGSGTNRTLTITPLANQFGTATITLLVADLDNGTATNSFGLTVTDVNDPPTIGNLTDQIIDEDVPMPVTGFVVGDVETAPGSLFVSATSTNTTLVPNANIVIGGSGANRTISLTPARDQFGITLITVTVADGGLAASDTFLLTVRPVNDPPSITTITNRTINEDTSTGPIPFTISDAETPVADLVLRVTVVDTNSPGVVSTNQIVIGGSGSNRNLTITPIANQSGPKPVVITLSVTDTNNATANTIFTLLVNPVDDPPTLDPVDNRTLDEDAGLQTVLLNGIGAGALNENQTVTVAATSDNPRLIPPVSVSYTSQNPTGTLTFTPVPESSGSAVITITVADNGAASNILVRTFTVTVRAVNDPPTLNPLGNVTVNEDSGTTNVSFSGVSSGATNETQTLVVSTSSSDPAIVPSPTVTYLSPNATGQLNVTPATNAAGTAVITVTVIDGGASNNLVARTFTVTVNPVNDPPTLAAIGNQTVDEDTGEHGVTLTGITSGPPNENQILTFTAVSSNPSVVPHPTIAYTNPDPTALLRFTSLTNQAGAATITVTVNDGGTSNSLVTRTFTVTVNPVNDPPTLNPIGPVSFAEDSGAPNVNFNGVSSGAPNESQLLVVTATSSNPALVPHPTITYASPTAAGTLTLRPLTNAFGVATITVTVSDGGAGSNSTSRSFAVTVNPVNDVPTISAIADQNILEDGATAPLAFTVGDLETDATNLTISVNSSDEELVNRESVVVAGTGTNRTVTVRPLPNQLGSVSISLIVFDSDGGFAITEFTVNVRSINKAPVIDPVADQTVSENGVLSAVPLTIRDDDTPASQLSVSAKSTNLTLLPSGSLILGGSGTNRTLRIQPAPSQFGVATIVISASDGVETATQAFALTVKPINRSPTITSLSDRTTDEDVPVGPMAITVGDRETPAGELRLTATSSNPSLVPVSGVSFGGLGSNRTVTVRPATNQFGSALITVGVEDSDFIWTAVATVPTVENNSQYVTVRASETMEVFRLTSAENGATPPRLRIERAGADLKISWPHPANGWVLERAPSVAGRAGTTFQLTVNPVNDAPLISVVADQTIPEDGTTGALPFTVEDVETPVANLTLTAVVSHPVLIPESGLVFIGTGTNRTVQVTPAADRFGTATITLTARDPDGAESTRTFLVTVFSVNEPPTLSAPSDFTIAEDAGPQTVNLAGIGSGEPSEVQPLTVTATSSNPALIPAPSVTYTSPDTTGTLSFAPRANAFGTATLTVTVDDEGANNNVVTRSFTVTVQSVNDLPAISTVGNQVIPEDTSAAAIPFTVGDVETATEALEVTATSSNPSVVPNAGLALNGTGTNRTVTVTPAASQSGTALITLHVADAHNGEATTVFTVTVVPVNDPPTLEGIATVNLNEDAGLHTINLTGLSTGAANETETLEVTAENSNPVLLTNLEVTYTSPNESGTLSFRTVTNAYGNATVTVRVNDGGSSNNLVQQTFTVTVQPVNDLPTITALGDQIIDEDVPTGILAFTVDDVETAAGSLIVTGSSSNPALVPASGLELAGSGGSHTLVVRPATNQFGVATLTVKVTDGDGGETTATFGLTVNSINDLPAITQLPAQATDEEVALVLPFVVDDVETPGNALILQATSSDTNLLPNDSLVLGGSGTNQTLTITPALNRHGTATLTVAVQDESGASVETSFPLTVRPVNDPPTLDAIADLALDEDAPAQTVNFAGISSGASDEVQSLVVTATTANPSLVTNLVVTHISPSATGSIRFVPVPNAYGSAVITVTVNDGGASNNIIQRSFTVNVRSINDPPSISDVTDRTTNEDVAVGPLAITIADVETPADALGLSFLSSNPALVNSNSVVFGGSGADRTVTITPLANQSGKATVTLTVTDADLGTASDSFELIVLPLDDAPTISDVPNQSVAEDGTLANVAFTVGDVESPAAQLLVLAASSNPALLPPTGLVLGGSGTNHTVSLTPAANQSGSATVTLTVVDPDGLSASNSFVLTVSAVNDVPVVSSIPAQTILEDTATGPLTWLVDDVETPAGALTVTGSSSNPGLVPNANVVVSGTGINRTVVVTPLANQFGTATITLTVTDGAGATTNSQFPLTVTPVNDLPTLNPLTNLALAANAGLQTVPLAGLGVGAANESQTLTVTATSSQPVLIPHPTVNYTPGSTTGTLTFTPVAGASGTATIAVTANDGGGGSSTVTRTFTVTVNAVGGPPSISNVPDQTTPEDTTIAVPFTVNDSETDPLRLTVTFGSSNPALVPTTNITLHGAGSERLVLLKPNPDVWGATTVTLTVSDGTSTASDTFVLAVVPVNDPPTLENMADVSRSEGFSQFSVSLLGVGSGATNEFQTCTITAVSSNTSLVVVDLITYTPGATSGSVRLKKGTALTGAAQISVTVNDGGVSNNTVTRSFMVYVKPTANALPTLSALTARTIQEGTSTGPVAFTIGDSQTPADQLILTAESLNPVLFPPANIVLGGTGANRTITVTPAPNQYGSNNIKIALRDSAYGFQYVTYPITVTPVNDAPTISAIDNQTNSSGTPTGLIPFVVSDLETAAGSLAVSATSANQKLVPNANILLGGSGTNRALRLTSVAGETGTATLTVTAGDGSLTSTQQFVLTVIAANTPPTLSDIADQTTPDGTPTSALPFTVGDAETPASLTLSASSSAPALAPTNNIVFDGSGSARTVTITPVAGQTGSATITVTVQDGSGGTASDSFLLTVQPLNHAPTLAALSNLSLEENAGPQTVNLSDISLGASDQNQTLFIVASSSNPALVPHPAVTYTSPNPTGTLVVHPAAYAGGTAVITVTVDDGQSQNNTVSRQFTVTVNGAPTITIAPLQTVQTVDEDTVVPEIPFTIGDLETPVADLLVTVSSTNPALVPNASLALAGTGANRTLTVTPLPNQFGSAFLELVVTDANKLKTTNGVYLFVRAVDDLPTLDPINPVTVYIHGGPVSVPLRGISAGPGEPGQVLQITAQSDNPSVVQHPTVHYTSPNSTGELIVTPAALGTATITVVADDGDLVSHAILRKFTMTVSDVPLRLTIQRLDANVVVTWPSPASGYVLERSLANTTPWTWTTVVDTPTVSGNQQSVTLPATSSMEVYRLSKSAP